MPRSRPLTGLLLVGLASTLFVSLGPAPTQAADPGDLALTLLDRDADGSLTVRASTTGDGGFVGVPAATDLDNPAVTPAMSAPRAAAAHLARYGAALGTAEPGTTLTRTSTVPTLTGDIVRYEQRVDGLPVLGGEVVVNLRADQELGSILATTSDQTSVPDTAAVDEPAAAATALAAARKAVGDADRVLSVSGGERWVYDPAVLHLPQDFGARSVWRFEVAGGPDVRRMVLVDDQTGAVVMDLDEVNEVDRIVCDNANVVQADTVACEAPVRSEGQPPSGANDVDRAYDYIGDTSAFFAAMGADLGAPLDLTAMIGTTVGGTPKIPATVNWCVDDGRACPAQNAFMADTGAYFGAGFANADDVVAHELTHAVTARSSGLIYLGESGAINESMSDVIGEIVDHRNGAGTDVTGDWSLGEDITGYGALRSMSDPPLFQNPDRVNGPYFTLDPNDDNAGVHTNSGVPNKTAWLISQGGSLDGQHFDGIDVGSDTGPDALTKTGLLYTRALLSLSSASGFADLADVLEQSCADNLAVGTLGFTQQDCDTVHKATVVTGLRTPVAYAGPAAAPDTCPTGSTRRVLWSTASGAATAFVGGAGWVYDRQPGWMHTVGTIAPSWHSSNPAPSTSSSLVAAAGVTIPSGQASYLRFAHAGVLDFDGTDYYDGVTVEVLDVAQGSTTDAAGLTWINGPTQVLKTGFGNPGQGRRSFSGFSPATVTSRADLSPYGGRTIKPRFTISADSSVSSPGWWVDDVVLYTCDPVPVVTPPAALVPGKPKVTGTARVGKKLAAKPGTWQPSGVSFRYQWLRAGKPIGKATKATYKLVRADQGKRISVRVTGTLSGRPSVTVTSVPTAKVKPAPKKHKPHR